MLKSAQSKSAKHFSKKCLVLLKKVPSTFQRTLYTFNVCVKSPGKVLKTFCPKISERKEKIFKMFPNTQSVCSHNLTQPWPGTDWTEVIQYRSQMSRMKAKGGCPEYKRNVYICSFILQLLLLLLLHLLLFLLPSLTW